MGWDWGQLPQQQASGIIILAVAFTSSPLIKNFFSIISFT